MANLLPFPVQDAFEIGQQAERSGLSLTANPFAPGTHQFTQWIIGYQWGGAAYPSQSNARKDRPAVPTLPRAALRKSLPRR
jgi:hypothetical protein